MKAFPLIALLLSSLPLVAQETSPAAANTSAEVQAFSNLPEEQRKKFIEALQEGQRLFQQKRIFETLDAIDKADKIFDGSSEVYNIRGSCYVEMRAFPKALAAYEKALQISPENPSVQFNIAEVLFVTKEWQKSNDLFYVVLAKLPENNPMARLVEFKILLCKKKLGLKDEATALTEKYDYQDDSPFYYFAQAAKEYDAGREVDAEQWLKMAGRIFRDPNVMSPWQDTMVEYGYIKSFYGDTE